MLLSGAVLSGAVLLAVLLAGGSSCAMPASARLSCLILLGGASLDGRPRAKWTDQLCHDNNNVPITSL